MTSPESIIVISRHILEKIDNFQVGTIGIILGSGLGEAITKLDKAIEIPYSEIPGFPQSTVKGHSGSLIYGFMQEKPILVFSGRFHIYEGYTAAEACTTVRVMGELGIKTIFITNAAGALNPRYDAGDLMLITDHINFTGHSPLTGPNHDQWGLRFPDMSKVYCEKLQAVALESARATAVRLERGVYVQVSGPNLETPAETRMLKMIGADAVGMSTAIEAVAAVHMGIKVMGIACLTNKNLPDCMAETTHEAVIEQAAKSSAAMSVLIKDIITRLN
ncbi:purine-nucleoside phosphorylase [Maridesulfovibrio hydrothermalis]|uniref:Purine nucleoside phosphorylase n=1 Tax=Maridesulfovibrio hydrothermalis AM13 = DSM 14728 TaxID=1121451 RepID=L0R642_9BACT|nr:purine-nucleoside phosphorylase [Maridesulfovibrio hydrothermalis]CCO22154.1 Purine nucleoside phosphorylase 1 [Maridesulfovibrio hydrothermalis AM13 = DSM 14728]